MLLTTRWILRVLNWLNWGLGGALVVLLLIIGFVPFELPGATYRLNDAVRSREEIIVLVRVFAVAIALVIPLAHIILTRLIAMIDSVPAGTALSILNAERLRQIAWALIGINVIDLVVNIVGIAAIPVEETNFALSPLGWIVALMLFILARIFREGAAMREELEGTV